MLFMKNRCIFKDLQLWDEFVSNLLYPAILGSLIYDIVKEFNDFHLKQTDFDPNKCIKFIFLFITAVFYIVDYFYMHYAFKVFKSDKVKKSNIETEKVTRTRCMIGLDILDTLSFAAIIIFINYLRYDFIIFPIMLIFLVEELYYIKNPETEKCCIISIVSWVSIIILLSFFYYRISVNCHTLSNCYNLNLLVIYGLIVVIYATKAISFYKEENLKNEEM